MQRTYKENIEIQIYDYADMCVFKMDRVQLEISDIWSFSIWNKRKVCDVLICHLQKNFILNTDKKMLYLTYFYNTQLA